VGAGRARGAHGLGRWVAGPGRSRVSQHGVGQGKVVLPSQATSGVLSRVLLHVRLAPVTASMLQRACCGTAATCGCTSACCRHPWRCWAPARVRRACVCTWCSCFSCWLLHVAAAHAVVWHALSTISVWAVCREVDAPCPTA
jgi:hypothetical protein